MTSEHRTKGKYPGGYIYAVSCTRLRICAYAYREHLGMKPMVVVRGYSFDGLFPDTREMEDSTPDFRNRTKELAEALFLQLKEHRAECSGAGKC